MKKLSKTLIELGIDFTFPIEIKNANGNKTYIEDSNGWWEKSEYDANGNETYIENNNGWVKHEYDANGNETYYENNHGFWWKCEYDANGNETYEEDSNGWWEKHEYDANGNETYYEISNGRRVVSGENKTKKGKNNDSTKVSNRRIYGSG